MSVDFRLPNITAKDEAGQLRQMQSYMFQLVEQLNYAMKTVDGSSTGYMTYQSKGGASGSAEDEKIKATFNAIKSLIIKSADIVNAYYDTINARLKGLYVAKSDYGTFAEQTNLALESTSTAISQQYDNIQLIISEIEGFENALIDVNAHIKSG